MTEQHPWYPPEDAVCCVDGCTLAPTGLRPSEQDFILEGEDGNIMVVRAGEVDEIVCSIHARGPQPDGSDAG